MPFKNEHLLQKFCLKSTLSPKTHEIYIIKLDTKKSHIVVTMNLMSDILIPKNLVTSL